MLSAPPHNPPSEFLYVGCIMLEQEVFVCARRQWNGHDGAKFRLSDVSSIHWSQVGGGVRARSPYAMIYGYVSCDAVLTAVLSTHAVMARGHTAFKVCFVRRDNEKSASAELSGLAGPKP
jgi:hypothetical protein